MTASVFFFVLFSVGAIILLGLLAAPWVMVFMEWYDDLVDDYLESRRWAKRTKKTPTSGAKRGH